MNAATGVIHAASDAPLRVLPKVELHCHVEGAARAQTVAELAAQHQIDIGVDDPSELYEYESLADFLAAFGTVCSVLQTADDFHRLAYEAADDGANAGIKYREMFFSPGFHLNRGIPFEVMWQGLAAGIAEGETDFGIRTRLILDVDKPAGLGPAMAMLEIARHLDHDLLIGIGGDSTERGVDHRAFAPLIAGAHNIGLKTCFHCGEDGPAENILYMVEAGIDRIDHGTRLLDLPDLARRVIDEQIPITSCPTSNVALSIVPTLADHPFAAQREAGALVTLNSDDPAFFQFDLADEYERIATTFGFDHATMAEINDAAITASWLDESEKTALRSQMNS